MDEQLLTIDVQRTATVVTVRVVGELDFGTAPQLLAALTGHAASGTPVVLVLDDLEFCDSSGLGVMIALYKSAAAHGSRLFVTGARPQVLAVITMTSLDQLFAIRDSVEAVYAEIGAS